MIYNSFTASYQSKDPIEKKSDPPFSLDEHYRQRFREVEEEKNEPPRTRRVQFAEQLEIDSKTKPQTPSTPTIPILRTRLNKRKPTPAKISQNRADPRDPTPRSSEKNSATKSRSYLKSNDPPTDASKALLFSPAAKTPTDIFSRLEKVQKAKETLHMMKENMNSQNGGTKKERSSHQGKPILNPPPTPNTN